MFVYNAIMKPFDSLSLDGETVWKEVEPFVDPSISEGCREQVLHVVEAIRAGGDTLADMIKSIGAAIEGLRMLAEGGDEESAMHLKYVMGLVQVCSQEQKKQLRRIAESN